MLTDRALRQEGHTWQAAQAFERQKGLLSPDENSIMSIAAALPRKLPTEKQCARLAIIKARLEDEGYRGI